MPVCYCVVEIFIDVGCHEVAASSESCIVSGAIHSFSFMQGEQP
jgi:hypothetical protein